VNIHFLLDAMELGGLTPYTGKFLGYTVEKGKLTLDLAYNIVKRKLDSTNTIFFDQFHLGDKVESPTATKAARQSGAVTVARPPRRDPSGCAGDRLL